ncbi:flavin monoamine oxidase family protein, partial [Coleofasciculus sp.]|uniref:flavin monoamine oxidase family protein n=1 Tax=Coleofasciculus sp. TaxID=3100458 RepID=UPI003A3308D9
LGGEFINTDHECMQTLAAELGLNLVDVVTAQEDLIQDVFFFEGRRLSLEEIIQAFTPVAAQIDVDLESIDSFENYTTPIPAAQRLDNLSIPEYLESIPTDPTLQKLIEVAYTIEYGLDAKEQSCLNLLYYIGTQLDEFKIFGESDERFYVEGGNDQIPRKLAQILANSIQTGTILESIRNDRSGRYRVSLRSGGRSIERTYERIVLAVPFSVLRTIELDVELPPVKRQAINLIGYGTNSKIITSYNEKVWKTRYNSRANVFTDLGFQTSWESSQSRFSPNTDGLVTNYTGGRQGLVIGTATPEVHARRFIAQFERVFPGISATRIPGQAVRAYWAGEQYSRGSYVCYRVGQWTQFYGSEGERVGNLFFAGEHTSLEFQGFMEGACETGKRAAEEILTDIAGASQRIRVNSVPLRRDRFLPFDRQQRQQRRQRRLQQLQPLQPRR